MKRGIAYLLVVCGLVLLVTNSTLAEAESIAVEMNLDITDSFYTNLESNKNLPEDDIVTEFEINLFINKYEIHDEYDDDEYDDDDDEYDEYDDDEYDEYDDDEYDDDEDRISVYDAVFKVYLKVSLVLPSGYAYGYSLGVYIGLKTTDFTIHFYNHATESGWYTVSIWAYLDWFEISAYDELIFDPPGGSGETDPPEIAIFAR
ncbi:MAG: hypothetical protein GOP50_10345 [Candidatus Heimdallarchaeota archaeon]|nr:hypothetical protein [Candidatus Heimdallarchaeota archaeon]